MNFLKNSVFIKKIFSIEVDPSKSYAFGGHFIFKLRSVVKIKCYNLKSNQLEKITKSNNDLSDC